MDAALSTETTTLAQAFLDTARRRGDAPAILTADMAVTLTWSQYSQDASRVAGGLGAAGLRRGQTLGLLLSNRPEFHLADAAALLLGAIPFSMYNTSAPEQFAHVIGDAGCRIVITEPALLARLQAGLEQTASGVDHVIVVGTPSWHDLLEHDPIEHPEPVDGDDVATLIYTSGTTGPPKGVELTHANILTMAREVTTLIEACPEDRAISALPMAHIAERASTHYIPMTVGSSVVCCPDYSTIMDLIPRVRPTVFFSPPRLWEKLRSAIAGAVDGGGTDPGALRQMLGFDRLRTALTGAAPCPPAVIDFFTAIGVPLHQLYGMSETTGIVSIPTGHGGAADAVGPPLPCTEIGFTDDGELLVRGPMVMAGYRNQPDATAETIDAQGWLHTGDIATLGQDGALRIVDRKKELIINAAGKNMSPSNIEARLKESSPLIGQACVIGDGRPFNVALIVADTAAAAALPRGDDLSMHIADAVARANGRLSRVEQIKRYDVLTDEWLPDSDELTPTMKLKRKPIAQKYANRITALYDGVTS
ncbi:hypothetical protein ASD37_30040 [Mycobacterium sp. Root135]|nr:hypothetical protein ASD37_30040 [Mycobacterium sp. Root135]